MSSFGLRLPLNAPIAPRKNRYTAAISWDVSQWSRP
jgi:hypothetical protein